MSESFMAGYGLNPLVTLLVHRLAASGPSAKTRM